MLALIQAILPSPLLRNHAKLESDLARQSNTDFPIRGIIKLKMISVGVVGCWVIGFDGV